MFLVKSIFNEKVIVIILWKMDDKGTNMIMVRAYKYGWSQWVEDKGHKSFFFQFLSMNYLAIEAMRS